MIESATLDDRETDHAICRGILYDVLALCLRPPGDDTLSRLKDAGQKDALREAAADLGGEEGPVPSAVEALLGAVESPADDLDRSFQRLFGHTARGQVSPYETEYGSDDLFRQSHEMADLGGFYRAFGLAVPGSRRERNDHLSAEFEFLSFLCRKEAYELLKGDQASGAEVRRAQRTFLRDHAGRFGRAFARSLVKEADQPFHRAAGELCLAFLGLEERELAVPLGPEFLPLRTAAEDDVPMACGSGQVVETVENFSAGGEAP
jgi:TorA maturation chaperone TorD